MVKGKLLYAYIFYFFREKYNEEHTNGNFK